MGIDFHTRPLILTYHSISAGHSPLCTPPEAFAEQMDWLASGGACVLRLGELMGALRRQQPLPRHAVVLTFDDGFRDFYDAAFPVLEKHRLPATVFVVTGYCGRTNRWPGQPAWVEESPLLAWSQIYELAGRNIEFGSHSATHPDLSRLGEAALEEEVVRSGQELEDQLGRPTNFFCYPYGRWSAAARAAVGRHYQGACGVAMERVRPEADVYAVPRIDAYYVRSPARFRQLFTLPGAFYLGARKVLRNLRRTAENLRGES
ncbi:MAG: polysaccharide deacetylase family protein [Acidobacteria bacterium]|nr:polysaccharide deacetylase family protein [Acidobacteriota bacterium]